jgi:1-phosphofructokinase
MTAHQITTVTLNPALDRTVIIPGFRAGAVNRVERMTDRPGGKGVNVAAALAARGQAAVAALGFLGRDNEEVFTAFFGERGIEDRCLRLPGSTRVGIKISDPVRGETTDINFPGLTPSPGDLDSLRAQVALLEGGWCVLAGSLPPGVAPGIYRELIATLKNRGVRTVLDTSGDALREALAAAPEIIKPNVHELEALLGRTLTTVAAVVAAARELIAGGVKLVVVSRGAEGACFVTDEEAVNAVPPAVEVHGTVGAGDAMVAGIVTSQILRLSLVECARRATAFSLSALTRTEEDSAAAESASVETFLSRVQVNLIS